MESGRIKINFKVNGDDLGNANVPPFLYRNTGNWPFTEISNA